MASLGHMAHPEGLSSEYPYSARQNNMVDEYQTVKSMRYEIVKIPEKVQPYKTFEVGSPSTPRHKV